MKTLEVYAAVRNSDLTEGRGSLVVFAYFMNLTAAVKAVQGQDVMGTNGSVYTASIKVWNSFDEWCASDLRKSGFATFNRDGLVYGYHRNWQGKWVHDYVDSDAPKNDPEYREYLRLKEKFGIQS